MTDIIKTRLIPRLYTASLPRVTSMHIEADDVTMTTNLEWDLKRKHSAIWFDHLQMAVRTLKVQDQIWVTNRI